MDFLRSPRDKGFWTSYALRKRKAIIDRIQVLFYEDVGLIKFGDVFQLAVIRKELRGDFRSLPVFYLWNAWLEKK